MSAPPAPGAWRLDRLLLAAMFGVMVAVAFINIVGRYLFHYSLAYTEELTINLFVGVVVIGSGMAFERGGHLGIEIFSKKAPPRFQMALRWFHALVAAALFLVVDILLIRECYYEITVFHARSVGLRVPVWVYYAAVVGLSGFVFRGIWRGVGTGTGKRAGKGTAP